MITPDSPVTALEDVHSRRIIKTSWRISGHCKPCYMENFDALVKRTRYLAQLCHLTPGQHRLAVRLAQTYSDMALGLRLTWMDSRPPNPDEE